MEIYPVLMFSGIVEETGRVAFLEERDASWRLRVSAGGVVEGTAPGDSIAVNGCCLTVVALGEDWIEFDLLAESLRLTNIEGVAAGARLNLERSLRFDGKVGGHFVSGHIDGLGRVADWSQVGKDVRLRVEPPEAFLKYLVYKGSVAVNGVSLTVAEVDDTGFVVWLIPHTLQLTNLGDLAAGRSVNLEFDLLAKYIERLIPGNRPIAKSEAPA